MNNRTIGTGMEGVREPASMASDFHHLYCYVENVYNWTAREKDLVALCYELLCSDTLRADLSLQSPRMMKECASVANKVVGYGVARFLDGENPSKTAFDRYVHLSETLRLYW